jgi:Na+/melibiose symporter-like transporter
VTFLTSLFLQYIKGLSPGDAGMILISQPIMMALFSPVAGRLSDRIEPRIIASIGMAITASGLIFLSMIRENTGLAPIVFCLMLLGQMLSMGIVTLIFALLIGRVQITNEYHPVFVKSFRLTLVIFSMLCTGGIFLSLSRGKLRKK